MISAFVNGQTLKLSTPKVVSDSVNYLTLKAVFQITGWEDLTKWVHFNNGSDEYIIELENDEITADKHLDLTSGEWDVYIHGGMVEGQTLVKRITTEIVKLTVEPTGVLNGEPLPITPPSLGEQILEIAQSVRDDADAGEFDGEKGDKGDPGVGVPLGGTTGQVLKKKTNSNFDTEWGDAQDYFADVYRNRDEETIIIDAHAGNKQRQLNIYRARFSDKVWFESEVPRCYIAPSSDGELTNKEYVDSKQVSVTPADAGKFMRVNSQGQWVAEEVPNASGVNF